jgi:hypothetical protein
MMLVRQSVVTLALFAACGTIAGAEQAVQAALPPGKAASIPVPLFEGSPVNYILDDGTAENGIGVNNGAVANQFFWFNRFDIDPTDLPLRVDQIQVFWANLGPNPPAVGNAFSIHIYSDADADPANGSTHVISQAANIGVVFTALDVHNITSAPEIASGVNLHVGLVNRWVTAGVSPQTFPAAIDQTDPDNVRSWVGGDLSGTMTNPPVMPTNAFFGTIDSFGAALAGDWILRATATVVPVELMGVTVE